MNMNQDPTTNSPTDSISDTNIENMCCESCKRAHDPSRPDNREFLALPEISAAFEQCMQHLQEWHCQTHLSRLFDHEHNFKLTHCICLGLGNFSTPHDEDERYLGDFTGPLHQLAVLTILLRVLREKHDIRTVYFQDPTFQPAEIQFLESLGYTVLDDPDAFDVMSASTFLFAPYCPYDVTARALRSALPALFVGNDPQEAGWSVMYRQRGPERVRAQQADVWFRFLMSTKDGEPKMMPEFDREEWLTKTQVRWLRSDYKRLERGSMAVFFFLFWVLIFLVLVWKRTRREYLVWRKRGGNA